MMQRHGRLKLTMPAQNKDENMPDNTVEEDTDDWLNNNDVFIIFFITWIRSISLNITYRK